DLSEWMTGAATPEGNLRIGLAHGAVQSFSEDGNGPDVVAPARARRAGLAYLALGDWHGPAEIDQHTRYPGAPEPGRFKHDRPGEALLVEIEGPASLPTITPVPTGSYAWRTIELELVDGDDACAMLESALPLRHLRRQSLVSLVARGRASLE